MTTKLDWKGIGQFMAVLVKLTTIITTTMREINVGLEILDWMTDAGKQDFIAMLKRLGEIYKRSVPIRLSARTDSGQPYVIHSTTVDLSVQPRFPSIMSCGEGDKEEPNMSLVFNVCGKRNSLVELRSDDNLYVDGVKIILHLEQCQRKGISERSGGKICDALAGKPVMCAALIDFLMKEPYFFPNHWKCDEQHRTRYVVCWGTRYRNTRMDKTYEHLPFNGEMVRYICWSSGKLICSGWYVTADFEPTYPAAMKES